MLATMSGKAFLNAIVLGGWLFASVVAFMIVAYTSFFGVGVVGLMIWFVCARVDHEQDGAVGAGLSPSFLAHQVRTRAANSGGLVAGQVRASDGVAMSTYFTW